MALFRKFFYKKPPDGLLEISERVYVFDYCFTTDVFEEVEYKVYIGGIIGQLREHFPDASFMVFNFREGDNQSQIASVLCEYDMTVIEYPRQYEGCPLLTMEMIHHFLRSSESWLQLGQQNVLLMHCERSGWPVLAFMLAALLIYRKQYTGEQKTLDMIYKQAPRELLQLMSPLNPLPSQLRYLQYISRRNVGSEWPPLDRALTLDCVIIRLIPNMDGEGGCRPIFRIYGQDPFMAADRTPKVLFSTPKRSRLVRHYKQADCELVKIDIHCHVQGDVVLECISLDSDLEREQMMFRVMFNTAFIRSNILMLNRDDIDILWNSKDQFPKDFRVEVLFSDMDASSSIISIDLPHIEEKEGLPVEAFAKVQEIFSNVDWLDSKTEVANVLQQITASNILLQRLDSGVSSVTSSLLKEPLSCKFKFEPKKLPENDRKNLRSTVQGEASTSSESFEDASIKKTDPLENDMKNLKSTVQGTPSTSLSESSADASIREKLEPLENDSKNLASTVQGESSITYSESSADASIQKKIEPLEKDSKNLKSTVQGKLSTSSSESAPYASIQKKIKPLENDGKNLKSTFQGRLSTSSSELSADASIQQKIDPLENDSKSLKSTVQGKSSTSTSEPSADASIWKKIEWLENDSKNLKFIVQQNSSTSSSQSSVEASVQKKIEASENDSKSMKSIVQGKSSTSSTESSADTSIQKKIEPSENDNKNLKSTVQGKSFTSSSELSVDASIQKKIEPIENDSKSLKSTVQGKSSTSSLEPSADASIPKKIDPLENDSKNLKSIVQQKSSISSYESSMDSSIQQKIEPFENDSKNLNSAVQGNSSTFSCESSADTSIQKKIELLENDSKNLKSTVQEKSSTSLYEFPIDTSTGKKMEPLESKELSENNIKTLASEGHGKQSFPSFGVSTDSNSTKTKKIESSESKAFAENDMKSTASVAQGKQSTSLIESSIDANTIKTKIEPSDPKALLETDTKCLTLMTQGKQSIPSIELSADANSIKKIEPLESKALSDNDIKTFASTAQRKQFTPLFKLSVNANSIKKKIDPQELQVALQLPTQSKIISPRVHQASRSTPVSYCNSLQGSPVPISRYHSAPSALGITALLQDHAEMDTKEDVTYAVKVSSSSSTLSPSVLKVAESMESSSTHVPPASSPALLPSLSSKASVDAPDAVEKSFEEPAAAAAPPFPFQVPQPISKSIVSEHPENTVHDTGQKTLICPPARPPSPVVINNSVSSPPHQTQAPSLPPSSTIKSSSSTPSPASPPPSLPLPSSFPGPHSTVNNSVKAPLPPPPPPSSTMQASFSIPPPPPLSGVSFSTAHAVSSPLSMNNSAIMSGPPPPPPPPGHTGITSGPTVTSSVPPPPPPPTSASGNSLSKNSATVPPVSPPPPPPPSATGLSKAGTASQQSHLVVGIGNAPPVPGPPAVPFGGKGRGLLRSNPKSQAQAKRSNLKPYHWLKLTRVMQGSLWAESQKPDEASKAPEFDMSELENLFSAVAPNSDGKGKSNRRSAGPKAEKVQLIELRRAYNCEIMLTKVKIPLPDLMSSVLALDDSALDVDQVENLIKFCPTKEEMEMLKGYTGDKDNLGKCEQFFLELMKVPRVESKLRVLSFKIQFGSQVSELRRDLNIVNSASEEIRNSVKLKRIMQTILSLGNALNHGTARGSAIGFRLDSLLKLTDTRARNNKMTLMHYLCKVLAEKLPELLDFQKDLISLEASTKIQLKYLAEEMQAISKGLERVVQELTASENDGPVSENFCKILKEFLSDAEAEVRSLAQLYANVGRNADALAQYFGEDPARCPFEQVVSTLLNFVRMFVRAHEENAKQIEFERKKAEKEAENEKLKLATKKESERMVRTTIKSGNIK